MSQNQSSSGGTGPRRLTRLLKACGHGKIMAPLNGTSGACAFMQGGGRSKGSNKGWRLDGGGGVGWFRDRGFVEGGDGCTWSP